jgi:hypothetical protein
MCASAVCNDTTVQGLTVGVPSNQTSATVIRMISQCPPECSRPAEASAMPLAQLAVTESALVTGHGEHACWGPAVAVDAYTAAAHGTCTVPGCLNHASAQLTALLGSQTVRQRRPPTAPPRRRRGRMPGSALRVMAVGQHPTRSAQAPQHGRSWQQSRPTGPVMPPVQTATRTGLYDRLPGTTYVWDGNGPMRRHGYIGRFRSDDT